MQASQFIILLISILENVLPIYFMNNTDIYECIRKILNELDIEQSKLRPTDLLCYLSQPIWWQLTECWLSMLPPARRLRRLLSIHHLYIATTASIARSLV